VAQIIVTARLVTDIAHTFGVTSILLFIMSRQILIKGFILHLFITQLICQRFVD